MKTTKAHTNTPKKKLRVASTYDDHHEWFLKGI